MPYTREQLLTTGKSGPFTLCNIERDITVVDSLTVGEIYWAVVREDGPGKITKHSSRTAGVTPLQAIERAVERLR